MSNATAFSQQGSTYLVVGTAISISTTNAGCINYRIRNLSTTTQYFTWAAAGATAPTSVGAPSAGTPSANTMGMVGNSVETFTLPCNVQMIASSATGFEVTPGDGL